MGLALMYRHAIFMHVWHVYVTDPWPAYCLRGLSLTMVPWLSIFGAALFGKEALYSLPFTHPFETAAGDDVMESCLSKRADGLLETNDVRDYLIGFIESAPILRHLVLSFLRATDETRKQIPRTEPSWLMRRRV